MMCQHPDKERIRNVISRVLPDVISDLIAEYVIICTKKVWHQSKRSLCQYHYCGNETFRNNGQCSTCGRMKIFRMNDRRPVCMLKRWITCGHVSSILTNVPSRYISMIIDYYKKHPERIEKVKIPEWTNTLFELEHYYE